MNTKLNNKLTNQKGKKNAFTIIEVVLVLAIAGLIFLIVFLALPGLQRSRRDTQRKSDVGKVLSQLENYASNSNGLYPDTQSKVDAFKSSYLNANDYKDPSSGSVYALTFENNKATTTNPTTFDTGTIYLGYNAKCDSSNHFVTGGNSVAIVTHLETGGEFCQGGS